VTPNRFCWNELAARDSTTTGKFYCDLFGWTAETAPAGPTTYTTFRLDGQRVGGMLQMTPEWAGIPPHWMPYVAVADVDATAARVVALGGKLRVPPCDISVGRFAVLADPEGAVFSVIRFKEA
jgi:predicted enzyme related to lactoylglutathione lyase